VLTTAIVFLALAVFGAGLTLMVEREQARDLITLNPSGGSGRALIICHPGLSDFPDAVAAAFAEGLIANGWQVDVTTASAHAPRDLARYDVEAKPERRPAPEQNGRARNCAAGGAGHPVPAIVGARGLTMDAVHLRGDHTRGRALIPGAITAARLLTAPWLSMLIARHEPVIQIIGLILFAAVTDALDGHAARTLGVTSTLGAYADACADYCLILAAFAAFIRADVYPAWTAMLITAMFVQFLLISGWTQLRYDPIGKSYGALLFGMIGITVALPDFAVIETLLLALVGMTAVSLACRYQAALRAIWHGFATQRRAP